MRFAFVLALTIFAWFAEEHHSRADILVLGSCAVAGFFLARSKSDRLSPLAPLAPALYLLVHALGYAAVPDRMRPIFAAALLGAAGLAAQLAIAPLVRPRWASRAVAMACLTFALYCFAFAGADAIYSHYQPVDPYAFAPIEGSAVRNVYLQDRKLGMVFRRGFRGRFVHPEYGGELVELNNCGFRDRDWPDQPDPDAVGILMLGDSSLFGMGVDREETIEALLEGQLAARHPGHAFRVYNAAVPSYGPRHELIVLRHLVDRLRPRVCIVCFQDANDLDDCRRQFVETREAGLHSEHLRSENLEKAGQFRPPDLFSVAVAPQSVPLWSRIYWARYSSLGRTLDSKITSRLAGLGWASVNYVYNHEFLRSMAREPDLGIQDSFRLAEDALHQIDDECVRRGIVSAVVRFPGVLQCEPSTFRRALSELGQDPLKFDRRLPGGAILEDARSHGVPTCDILPVFEVGEGERCSYYFHEGHPNRAGDARIAQAILSFLEADEKLAGAIGASAGEHDR